jgi:hypothetical protein
MQIIFNIKADPIISEADLPIGKVGRSPYLTSQLKAPSPFSSGDLVLRCCPPSTMAYPCAVLVCLKE